MGKKPIQKQLASMICMMRFDKKDEKKTHPKTVGLLDLDDEVWQKGGDHLPPKNNNNSRHPWFGWWVLTKRKTPTIGILDSDNEVKGRDPKKHNNNNNKKTAGVLDLDSKV